MTIQELRTEHDQAKTAAASLYQRTKAQADSENRGFTSSEAATVQAALDRANALKKKLGDAESSHTLQGEIDRLTSGLMPGAYGGRASVGDQFLQSPAGRWLAENKNRGSRWETPIVEIMPPGGGIFATTITENPTTGGITVPPQYLPGIVPIPLRPAVVADLLSSGTTTSNAIVSMRETAYTNAAAAVAEGSAKGETAITFAAVTDPVVKIAHWIPITDELLDDVPAMSGYISARLLQGLQVPTEDQLLNGNGTAPNMLGLLNRPGLAAPIVRTDPDTNADAIAKMMAQIQASTYLTPTGVIMHPTNFETILLSKTTLGSYIGASPFMTPLTPSLWGRPVAITKAIAVNTALVVCQSEAMVFRRGGIAVQASNSHQDFFVKNLTAVRAEERLALAVFRAACFGLVTGLN